MTPCAFSLIHPVLLLRTSHHPLNGVVETSSIATSVSWDAGRQDRRLVQQLARSAPVYPGSRRADPIEIEPARSANGMGTLRICSARCNRDFPPHFGGRNGLGATGPKSSTSGTVCSATMMMPLLPSKPIHLGKELVEGLPPRSVVPPPRTRRRACGRQHRFRRFEDDAGAFFLRLLERDQTRLAPTPTNIQRTRRTRNSRKETPAHRTALARRVFAGAWRTDQTNNTFWEFGPNSCERPETTTSVEFELGASPHHTKVTGSGGLHLNPGLALAEAIAGIAAASRARPTGRRAHRAVHVKSRLPRTCCQAAG